MDTQRAWARATAAALALLGAALLGYALLSLQWRVEHDSPLLFYAAFLMRVHGCVPYRDFFDVNPPGTYVPYYWIDALARRSDLGVRLADLALLGALSWLGWRWMRPLGARVAWAGAILWGTIYLQLGPVESLQREELLLLPIGAGAFLLTRAERWSAGTRAALAGACFGCAALVKPHAALGLPLLLALELWDARAAPAGFLRGRVAPALAGALLPPLAALVYLWRNEALKPFLEIAREYWPLYAALDKHQTVVQPGERLGYLARGYAELGGFRAWLIPAGVGTVLALRGAGLAARERRHVGALLALAIGYSLYPVLAGKFWTYHWLLCAWFLAQLSALCLAALPARGPALLRCAPALLVLGLGAWTARPNPATLAQLRGEGLPPPKSGRVDALAEFLRANLRPGDTVQPLDWTGGALQAMWMTEARIATPFLYDMLFYHHVSLAYTQGLRRRFLDALEGAKPRFVLQVSAPDKPWPRGPDTARTFPELRALLERDYAVVARGEGYLVHERKGAER